jgi:hypothetical protein
LEPAREQRSEGQIWGGIWIAYMQNRVENTDSFGHFTAQTHNISSSAPEEAQSERPGILKKEKKASFQHAQFANLGADIETGSMPNIYDPQHFLRESFRHSFLAHWQQNHHT